MQICRWNLHTWANRKHERVTCCLSVASESTMGSRSSSGLARLPAELTVSNTATTCCSGKRPTLRLSVTVGMFSGSTSVHRELTVHLEHAQRGTIYCSCSRDVATFRPNERKKEEGDGFAGENGISGEGGRSGLCRWRGRGNGWIRRGRRQGTNRRSGRGRLRIRGWRQVRAR